MRFVPAAALLLLSALASGCTIHVVEQPASAQTWGAPQPVSVYPERPHPGAAPRPARPSVAERRRVASGARPSSFGPVTAAPTPATPARPEPRPTKPVTSKPVVSKPSPSRPSTEPSTDKPKGRYPFRLTRPEPRRPDLTTRESEAKQKRPRTPVAVAR